MLPNIKKVLCLLLVFQVYVMAAWEDVPQLLLNDETLQASAAQVSLGKYPNANIVTLDDRTYIRYLEDGKNIRVNDYAVKILTEKGRLEHNCVDLEYDRAYSSAGYHLVRLIKADGRIIDVDWKTLASDMVNADQMESNIYDPNHRNLKLAIPDLEIGDILRVSYYIDTFAPRIPDSYYGIELLQFLDPIAHASVQIVGPASLPLRKISVKDKIGDSVQFTREEKDDLICYCWEAEDVKQLMPEPNMPNMARCLQRVLVSTFESWDEVSLWYWNLCSKHFESNAEMREKVSSLIDGLPDDMQRIRAIFKFVSQEIRYMGVTVETEAPGYEPHDVVMTFTKRHGVCRDKAALLAAMLRIAGYDASTVLISAGYKIDVEVPIPYFNHAITGIKMADGSFLLMDSTNEKTRELLPGYLADNTYLIARNPGEDLQITPVIPSENNAVDIKTSGEVYLDGSAKLTTTICYGGINDNFARSDLLKLTADERRNAIEKRLQKINATAKMLRCEILPLDLQNTDEPLKIILQYTISDAMLFDGSEDGEEGTAVLNEPAFMRVALVNNVINDWNVGLDKRDSIYRVYTTAEVRQETSLKMPYECSYPAAMPEFAEINDGKILWKKEIFSEIGHLTINSIYAIRDMEWTPEEYLALKEQRHEIARNNRKQLVLRRLPSVDASASEKQNDVVKQADAEIEDWRIDYRVFNNGQDWDCTQYKRIRILTYNGIKDNGEIALPYNSGWENVKLNFAKVINEDGEYEISPAEINLMDQPWVGEAARYPAGKILVVSLPGVKIGSVIEIEWTHSAKAKPCFAFKHSLQTQYPVACAEVSIVADRGVDFDYGYYDQGILKIGDEEIAGVQRKSKLEDGTIKYSWHYENLPAYFYETYMPEGEFFLPTVCVSNGNWKKYGRSLLERIEELWGGGPNMDALFTLIAATPRDKQLQALHETVDRMVHLVDVSFASMPMSCISSPETTLADGYGDDMDKGVVIYHILKRLGYEPEIYLFAPIGRYDKVREIVKDYPDCRDFSSMRILVKDADGHDIWLNNVSKYAKLGVCDFDGQPMLALKSGKISCLDLADDLETWCREALTIEINEVGDAVITCKSKYYGQAYENFKKLYLESTPEERMRRYQQEISGIFANAHPVTPEPIIDVNSYPATREFTVCVEDFAVVDGDFMYFNVPVSLTTIDCLEHRRNYLYFPGCIRDDTIVNLRLPSKFSKIEICPSEFSWTSPSKAGHVSIKYDTSPEKYSGNLRMRYMTDIYPELFSPEQCDELLEVKQKTSSKQAIFFMLRKRGILN